jgi:hypothetical protein
MPTSLFKLMHAPPSLQLIHPPFGPFLTSSGPPTNPTPQFTSPRLDLGNIKCVNTERFQVYEILRGVSKCKIAKLKTVKVLFWCLFEILYYFQVWVVQRFQVWPFMSNNTYVYQHLCDFMFFPVLVPGVRMHTYYFIRATNNIKTYLGTFRRATKSWIVSRTARYPGRVSGKSSGLVVLTCKLQITLV